jgi:hypothetical protein
VKATPLAREHRLLANGTLINQGSVVEFHQAKSLVDPVVCNRRAALRASQEHEGAYGQHRRHDHPFASENEKSDKRYDPRALSDNQDRFEW